MNKNLIYVGGAILGIGAAVALFSVMGDDSDTPVVDPVTEPSASAKAPTTIEGPSPGARAPKSEMPVVLEGTEERRALLKRPAADFALRSEVTLKVLAGEVRKAGDEALADEIMAHVIAARKERYNEDLDGDAFITKVEGFAERAGNTSGMSSRGTEAHGLLVELIAEYR